MAFPSSEPHPVIPLPAIMRVSAALAAAGAWDATPLELASAGYNSMLLAFSYTRGAAAGAFDFQIEYSLYSVAANAPAGAAEWVTEAIYAGGGVAAGVDTQSMIQREFQTYQATGAAIEGFLFGVIEFDHAVERVRITARESGNVGTPGTLQITAMFGRE